MAWQRKRSTQVSCLILCVVLGLPAVASARQKTVKPARIQRSDNAVHEVDAAIRARNTSLDSIKSELDRGRKRLALLERQEGNESSRLNQLDTNIRTAERYLAAVGGKIRVLGAEIHMLDTSLTVLGSRLRKRQSVMAVRLRDMYVSGSEGLLQTVLTSGSLTQVLDRVRYFQTLHRYDTLLMHAIDSTREQAAVQKTQREAKRDALYALSQAKQREQLSLETERLTRQNVMREIQTQKSAYLVMIKELETAQRELNDLIKKLAARKKPSAKPGADKALARVLEKRRGSYPWPVAGAVVRGFGKIVHPVYKTVTMSNGIDIGASKGARVGSITAGKIVYVGRMRGMGTFLVVDHSGGLLSVYARLDQVMVAMNQAVAQGTVLATVGDMGAGSEPMLHFEIRKNGEAVDPLEWLLEK